MKKKVTKVKNKNKDLQVPFNKFKHLLSKVDLNHLKICPCHNELVENEFRKIWKVKQVELGDNIPDYVIKSELENARVDAIKNVINKLPIDTVCPLESANVINTLSLFSNSDYNLNDPVVFGIIKNALSIELNTFRLQLLSRDSNLLRTVQVGEGYKWELNPAVEASRRSSETVIRALEILSKIVHGEKSLNLNVDTNLEAIHNVWKKRGIK